MMLLRRLVILLLLLIFPQRDADPASASATVTVTGGGGGGCGSPPRGNTNPSAGNDGCYLIAAAGGASSQATITSAPFGRHLSEATIGRDLFAQA